MRVSQNGLIEKFEKLVESLNENDRKQILNYTGQYEVYVAKIRNPKSGKTQVRIELKAKDKFKPTVVLTRYRDYRELLKFIEWLRQREPIVKKLSELNGEFDFEEEDLAEL